MIKVKKLNAQRSFLGVLYRAPVVLDVTASVLNI